MIQPLQRYCGWLTDPEENGGTIGAFYIRQVDRDGSSSHNLYLLWVLDIDPALKSRCFKVRHRDFKNGVNRTYHVLLHPKPDRCSCECGDWEFRHSKKGPCKHLWSLAKLYGIEWEAKHGCSRR